ncbi:MAG TPA: hypothetical protein VFN71_16030 [Methylomirabilota bacterium]|nr:hypothetical protein [Methylomirabilota bacterium]
MTEQAGKARATAQRRITRQVDERSTQVGDQAGTLANAMRTMSEELRGQGHDGVARVSDEVAARTDRLGRYLRDADADRLLHDAETFARRQPWLIAAGGLAIGLLAARFLKASSRRRYRSRLDGGRDYQQLSRERPPAAVTAGRASRYPAGGPVTAPRAGTLPGPEEFGGRGLEPGERGAADRPGGTG